MQMLESGKEIHVWSEKISLTYKKTWLTFNSLLYLHAVRFTESLK